MTKLTLHSYQLLKQFFESFNFINGIEEHKHFGFEPVFVVVQDIEDFVDDVLIFLSVTINNMDIIRNTLQRNGMANLFGKNLVEIYLDAVLAMLMEELFELFLHGG